MTSNRWDAWEPQEPPDDFAARTVSAALADRAERRRTFGLGRGRAALVGAVAAVMCRRRGLGVRGAAGPERRSPSGRVSQS